MQTQLNFFNTIGLQGEQLAERIKRITPQENRILEIMKVGHPMTPFEVKKVYDSLYFEIPITSVRRAITCLTDRKLLKKRLDLLKVEMYGEPNHCWEKI